MFNTKLSCTLFKLLIILRMDINEGTFTFTPISDKYTDEWLKNRAVPDEAQNLVLVNPGGYIFPPSFELKADVIRDFEVFPDDVWILTFPRSGTTWTQEMVWLMKNNFDFEQAKTVELQSRVPFLEMEAMGPGPRPDTNKPRIKSIEKVDNLPRPRCVKSHLPRELLPKQLWTVKPKVIVVTRDPRDVVISFYHQRRLFGGYQGTMEKFIDIFLNDRVTYGPYWRHVLSFFNLEDKSHILFNTYEDMKRDLEGVIRKTAAFLNVTLTNENVEALKEHISFKSMSENKMINCDNRISEVKKEMKSENDDNLRHIRKGESGAWKKEFGNDTIEKFKNWYDLHLKGTAFPQLQWDEVSN